MIDPGINAFKKRPKPSAKWKNVLVPTKKMKDGVGEATTSYKKETDRIVNGTKKPFKRAADCENVREPPKKKVKGSSGNATNKDGAGEATICHKKETDPICNGSKKQFKRTAVSKSVREPAKKKPKRSTGKTTNSHDNKCQIRQQTLMEKSELEREFQLLKRHICQIVEGAASQGITLGSIKSDLRKKFPMLEPNEYKKDHPILIRIPEVVSCMRSNKELLLLSHKYVHVKLLDVNQVFDDEKQVKIMKKLKKAKTTGVSFSKLKKNFKPEVNLKMTLLYLLESGRMVQKGSNSKLCSTEYVK